MNLPFLHHKPCERATKFCSKSERGLTITRVCNWEWAIDYQVTCGEQNTSQQVPRAQDSCSRHWWHVIQTCFFLILCGNNPTSLGNPCNLWRDTLQSVSPPRRLMSGLSKCFEIWIRLDRPQDRYCCPLWVSRHVISWSAQVCTVHALWQPSLTLPPTPPARIGAIATYMTISPKTISILAQ